MRQKQRVFSLFLLSPSSRRAWIEMLLKDVPSDPIQSPSSRRAWIEIPSDPGKIFPQEVALLAEGVDRNMTKKRICIGFRKVALLAEGVDRNSGSCTSSLVFKQSPSSRRAWIEIQLRVLTSTSKVVALLAEGVDRNIVSLRRGALMIWSPSSRRAWIEICTPCSCSSGH